jgi:hypothetical protein
MQSTGQTLAKLAMEREEYKDRFEQLYRMRRELARRQEVMAEEQSHWRSLPKTVCRSLVMNGPIGEVFAGSIVVSRSMRATLFVCSVLGDIGITTLTFVTTEGPRSKGSACKSDCSGSECIYEKIGRFAALGLVTAVVASFPVSFFASLHSRHIKHVDDEREMMKQVQKWRRKDRVLYVLGLLYSSTAILCISLFFANVSTDTHLAWFMCNCFSLSLDFVIVPVVSSFTMPVIVLTTLTIASCRSGQKKRELIIDEHDTAVNTWYNWGHAKANMVNSFVRKSKNAQSTFSSAVAQSGRDDSFGLMSARHIGSLENHEKRMSAREKRGVVAKVDRSEGKPSEHFMQGRLDPILPQSDQSTSSREVKRRVVDFEMTPAMEAALRWSRTTSKGWMHQHKASLPQAEVRLATTSKGWTHQERHRSSLPQADVRLSTTM